MSSELYSLDADARNLVRIERKSAQSLGFSEAKDVEAWLASAGPRLFGRNVLWIARQDRPSSDQRSDLLGVDDEGDLVVAELKRGTLSAEAITQALAYAAEYAQLDVDAIVNKLEAYATKVSSPLVAQTTQQDPRQALTKHVDDETQVNGSQVLVLVAEDFDPKALAICDYLTSASGDATFSIECWGYAIFARGSDLFLTLNQVFPPPNTREQIEEKREEAKARKYARDPVRVALMKGMIAYLRSKSITVKQRQGQSYECKIDDTTSQAVTLSVRGDVVQLIAPPGTTVSAQQFGVVVESRIDGTTAIAFPTLRVSDTSFTDAHGEALLSLLGALTKAG